MGERTNGQAPIELRVLGPVTLMRAGFEVPIGGRRARALLAYLALNRRRPVSPGELLAWLWTEPPPTAAKIVHITVSRLRKVLPDGVLVSEHGGYRLDVDGDAVDAARFARLTAAGRKAFAAEQWLHAATALETALGLWRGEPLADLDDEPFAAVERHRLEDLRIAATEDYAAALNVVGRHAEVVEALDRLVGENPSRERLVRELMLALYRTGRQADALALYREVRRRLVEELGIEPGPELRRLERAVLAQDPGLDAGPVEDERGSSLPLPPERIVGREQELEVLETLLGEGRGGLVTLTGPGGVGKTRLALEGARRVEAGFPGGVVFVSFETIADPDLALAAVTRVLGREAARKRRLIVLDGLEHLLAAAPALARVIAESPGVTFLATSRERLRIGAERELQVPPLAVPEEGVTDVEHLGEAPSVALFVERSRQLDPRFELSAANARVVSEICRRVEGLPLSIELAAARTRLLTPPVLLDRLASRLDVLTAGAPDAPPRHRTLRATIDWSFDLLDFADAALLAELSVFAGGWTLEAAEAICTRDGNLLDRLSSLIDKSLIRREPGEDLRFGMLDSIRDYALERLAASGDAEAIRLRHRDYFTGLAEQAFDQFCGPHEGEWLDRLEREQANLRDALESALAGGDGEASCRLAASLGRFWFLRGYFQDGRRLLEETLARASAAPESRGRVLTAAGRIAAEQGDLDAADGFFRESLALARERDDRGKTALILAELGTVALYRENYSTARAFLEESAAIDRSLGEVGGVAVELHQLALVALSEGELERARTSFEESIALAREVESTYCLSASLRGLAGVLVPLGETGSVPGLLSESLVLAQGIGDRHGIAEAIELVAVLAAAQGASGTGALLLGASERARAVAGNGLLPYEQARRKDALHATDAGPGGREFETYQRGLNMPFEQALDAAEKVIST